MYKRQRWFTVRIMPYRTQANRIDGVVITFVDISTAKALETGFGMTTVRDLLLHAPRRYVERGQLSDLSSLHEGDEVTVVAEVRSARVKPMRGGRNQMLEVIVTDGTAELSLTFFRQAWRAKDLSPGRRGLFAGKVNRFNRRLQLTHPDYLILSEDDAAAAGIAAARDFAGSLIPVYPATGSMKTWKISNAVTLAPLHAVGGCDPATRGPGRCSRKRRGCPRPSAAAPAASSG